MKQMKIDALCIPAHKGLLGPQGCGAVIFGKGMLPRTLVEGGNGVNSLVGEMLGELPERYEAGTLPAPSIAGLCEGIRIVREVGVDTIADHERRLFSRAAEMIGKIRGTRIILPQYEGSVFSFEHERMGSEELAARLSDEGICTRAGFHCCALGHRTLGTASRGTVRVSFGVYNSSRDVERLTQAVKSIVNS
jgi:selenocysteine lyase/cysteine desulfurase